MTADSSKAQVGPAGVGDCPGQWIAADATAGGATPGLHRPRFIHSDVTRLHDLGAGDGYRLLVDFGCLRTLPEDRRPPPTSLA
ncbi:hypothetical protein HD597_012931 [Nonomuraea thailandensis]|uniref:Uncharacterized protein n=1 Tax=Nonomuraea thailandensis TaxID=1188745 RepID=A0A9X2K9J3_9ACTN|nr:hypothetical protein [Nonomuraea thailandensis]MCP2365827.1 hypothetical protein [Nonomuraea thailandensis]